LAEQARLDGLCILLHAITIHRKLDRDRGTTELRMSRSRRVRRSQMGSRRNSRGQLDDALTVEIAQLCHDPVASAFKAAMHGQLTGLSAGRYGSGRLSAHLVAKTEPSHIVLAHTRI